MEESKRTSAKTTVIEGAQLDEERALYGRSGLLIKNCRFEGPADGESALKECTGIRIEDCFFDLRYPLWHDRYVTMSSCVMTENCRASLWYSTDIEIENSRLGGIKALRECSGFPCGTVRLFLRNSAGAARRLKWKTVRRKQNIS